MAVILHVGNLPWQTSADDLYELFRPHGLVLHAQVIMDRDKGRSRGFGFVEMAVAQEADRAITALHKQLYAGRPLAVAEVRR